MATTTTSTLIDDLTAKIVNALLAARERVLERESLADALVLSRGPIEDHISVEIDTAETILTVSTHAKTSHGAHIVAELKASSIDLPPPARH